MNLPKLVPSGKSTATTYHFSCEPRGFGWALASVNDQTGELLVMSDWGHWSHRWSANPKHLGTPTLTHFIADRKAAQYMADKLTSEHGGDGHYPARKAFDFEKTISRMKERICRGRLEDRRGLSKGVARELWEALDEMENTESAESFLEQFYRIDGYSIIDDTPYDSLAYSHRGDYLVLRDAILPALIEACAVTIAEREKAGHEKAVARG